MTYKQFIYSLKQYWIGRKVVYNHHIYNVVDVDYNGHLIIDMPTKYTDSFTSDFTAVSILTVTEV